MIDTNNNNGNNRLDKVQLSGKVFFIIAIVEVILLYIRCFFGTEITDEAYYVSNALTALHGNWPFVFNMSRQSGMSLIEIPFLYLYELIVPSQKGIFLFSRLLYVTAMLGVFAGIYNCLKFAFPKDKIILSLCALIPSIGFCGSMLNFSYNTVGVYFMILSATLCYNFVERDRNALSFMWVGFFMTISAMAHPLFAISGFVLFVLILGYSKEHKVLNSVFYILGVVVQFVLVLVPIGIRTGISKLIYGLNTILFYQQHKPNSATKLQVFWGAKPAAKHAMLVVILFVLTYYLMYVLSSKNKLSTNRNERAGIATLIAIIPCVVQSFIVIRAGVDWHIGLAIGVVSLLIVVVTHSKYLMFVFAPFCMFILAEMFLANPTEYSYMRIYFMTSMAFAITLAMLDVSSVTTKRVAVIFTMLISVYFMCAEYGFVYRDGDGKITELNTKMQDGVYAGVYTTEVRKNDIKQLEEFLDEHISDSDYICFKDNVPAAYLIKNHNICDVRTWDEMSYGNGCNDPESTYRYFKNVERIPDKIIYIHIGRPKPLSTDDESFRFNKFVDKYYDNVLREHFNETFPEVSVYENNGTFDGDYDSLFNLL